MAKKSSKVTSPKAKCLFPFLNKPNTKWNDDGVYSVAQVYPEDHEFIKKLQELAEAGFEELKSGMRPAQAKKAQLVYPFTPIEDEEGEETGEVMVRYKMNAQRIDKKTQKVIQMKPRIYDAKNQLVKRELPIGNGSIINVNFTPLPTAVKKEVYLSLWMNAVRIVELVEFAPDGSAMFGDEEDGFDNDEFDGGGTVDGEEEIDEEEEF